MLRNIVVDVLEGTLGSTADPYVTVFVGENTLANWHLRAHTPHQKSTATPVFNEKLEFHKVNIHMEGYNKIYFEVWNNKWAIIPDVKLGEASIVIDPAWLDGEPQEFLLPLHGGRGVDAELTVRVHVHRTHTRSAARRMYRFIKSEHKRTERKWVDPEFPHDKTSLTFHGILEKGVVAWKRPQELNEEARLFFEHGTSGDVIQGKLGDCWLISALSIVATRPQLLQALVVKAEPEMGFYTFKLFKGGQWRYITVDDALPVDARDNLVFGSCKNPAEFWVPLLEKAFAKLYRGNYEALDAGMTSEGLFDLTGEGAEYMYMDDERFQSWVRDGSLETLMKKWAKNRFLIGCSKSADGSTGAEQDTGEGILAGHAYSVLKIKYATTEKHYLHRNKKRILLQLRNPWGNTEWRGAYSDGSAEWTAQLRRQLKQTDANDGVFWMTYEDWLAHFDRLDVVRLFSHKFSVFDSKWHKRGFVGEWSGATAGGCMNYDTWTKNAQYALSVDHPGEFYIYLSQPDKRYHWAQEYRDSIGCYLLKVADNSKLIDERTHILEREFPPWNDKTLFTNKRDLGLNVQLEKGHYIIIPVTFHANVEMSYYLGVFSETRVERCAEIVGKYDIQISGEWTALTSGGPPLAPSFENNPKYVIRYTSKLRIKERFNLSIRCEVAGVDPPKIGFRLYKKVKLHNPHVLTKGQLVCEEEPSTRTAQKDVECLKSDKLFCIVVFTDQPEKLANFTIFVETTQPGLSLEPYH